MTDAVILVAGAAATWAMWRPAREMAPLVPAVLVHFFLFCNVFRIRRSYELVWAAAFIANLLAWQAAGAFSWASVLLAQTPVTIVLVVMEMRGGRYHGVGWTWINPKCPEYRPGVNP